MRTYRQLTSGERYALSALRKQGLTQLIPRRESFASAGLAGSQVSAPLTVTGNDSARAPRRRASVVAAPALRVGCRRRVPRLTSFVR